MLNNFNELKKLASTLVGWFGVLFQACMFIFTGAVWMIEIFQEETGEIILEGALMGAGFIAISAAILLLSSIKCLRSDITMINLVLNIVSLSLLYVAGLVFGVPSLGTIPIIAIIIISGITLILEKRYASNRTS